MSGLDVQQVAHPRALSELLTSRTATTIIIINNGAVHVQGRPQGQPGQRPPSANATMECFSEDQAQASSFSHGKKEGVQEVSVPGQRYFGFLGK